MRRRVQSLAWIVWVLAGSGCGAGAEGASSASAACIADHLPAEPFDVGDVTPAGLSPDHPNAAKPGLDEILDVCRSAGGGECEADRLISRAAAACIAQVEEFGGGAEVASVSLSYFGNYERMAWAVESSITEQPSGVFVQHHMVIDAVTGHVLARQGARVDF